MLTYAIDTPAPSTLVVISGDRDFVYAISVLRWRRYSVVLVAPNSAHASLRSQASVILDWEADVLGKRAGNANTNMHRRTQSSGSMLVPSPIAQRGARRLSSRETSSTPNVEFLQPSPDIIDPRHRATRSQSNSSAKKPVIPSLSSSSSSVPQSAFVTPIRQNDALPVADDACSSTQGQISETETIVDLNDHLRSLDEERSRTVSTFSYVGPSSAYAARRVL